MAVDYKPHYVIPAEIPDGEYWGKWTAYVLTFEHDGKTVEQSTKQGIRGMNIRTKFRYVNGELDQESLDPHGPSTVAANTGWEDQAYGRKPTSGMIRDVLGDMA